MKSLFLAAALLSPLPTADVAPTPQKADWGVDWGEQRCTLYRPPTGSTEPIWALAMIPGTQGVEIMLANSEAKAPRWGGSDTKPFDILLQPNGVSVQGGGTSGGRQLNQKPAVSIYVESSFLDSFAAARSMSILDGGETIFRTSFAGAAKAVAALRQCEDDMLRRWGIDPGTFRSLAVRAKPKANLASYFMPDDYPEQALREKASGEVVVRLNIDEQGQIAACEAVKSSGHRSLDDGTCAVLRKRRIFLPARDKDGQAASDIHIATIMWRM